MDNIQPREKRTTKSDYLSVHSVFQTIQGEGPFCGVPCVFIRLAGCNLQCPACDTDYTSGRSSATADELVQNVKRYRADGLVVITGGEPFRQNIQELCMKLFRAGYFVQIESNGTLPAPDGLPFNKDTSSRWGVYLVCSPKTGKVDHSIAGYACAFKYVLEYGNVRHEDGLPLQALRHTASPYPARPPEGWRGVIYVQPLDSKDDAENLLHLGEAIRSSFTFGYTLQLQIHKIIEVA